MDDALVASGEACLKIDRELRRCSNDSIKVLEQVHRSTVLFKFPPVMPKKCTTTLVLKAPKTESSNRIVYLPLAVVEELRKVKEQQRENNDAIEKLKILLRQHPELLPDILDAAVKTTAKTGEKG